MTNIFVSIIIKLNVETDIHIYSQRKESLFGSRYNIMAKVDQNKLIGGLAVAVITLVVVIIIVVIAQQLFPENTRQSSSTVLGTGTSKTYTANTAETPSITNGGVDAPAQTTTPSQGAVTTPGSTTTTNENTGSTVYLNTSVYLRSTAGWDGVKGGIIPVGDSAVVKGEENGWYLLEYNGEQGYVYKDYISQSPIS